MKCPLCKHEYLLWTPASADKSLNLFKRSPEEQGMVAYSDLNPQRLGQEDCHEFKVGVGNRCLNPYLSHPP